ncbi:unnamed protein product [Paramecium sonneborni]|uniref:WD40-repeat-containing domain n=1 Tax=Paramecium sonneborni TaxID=65129 RepID=A0A8S1RS82_9CILI|nr:unnamed protein product [Paramecium sonneborni]
MESQKNICDRHKQKVIFNYRQSPNSNYEQLCSQCIDEMRYNLKATDDSLHQLGNIQSKILEDFQSSIQKKMNILKNSKIILDKLALQFSEFIKRYTECFNQQQKLIEDSQIKFLNNIQNISKNDIYQFFKEIQDLQQQQFKDKILEKSLSFQNIPNQLIQKIKSNLSQIIIELQNYINEIKESYKNIIKEPTQICENFKLQCRKHKGLQIIMVDLNWKKTPPERLVCQNCIEEFPTFYITLDRFQQLWYDHQEKRYQLIEQLNQQMEVKQSQIKVDTDFLKNNLIKSINQFLNSANDCTNRYLNQGKSLKLNKKINWSKIDKQEALQIADILSLQQEVEQSNRDVVQNYNEFVQTINSQKSIFNQEIIKLFGSNLQFNQRQKQEDIQQQIQKPFFSDQNKFFDIKIQEQQQKFSDIQKEQVDHPIKKLDYKVLQEYNIKQKEGCYAIAISDNNSTLMAGSKSQIKVFQFNNGKMKETQQLIGHQNDEETNQFISGGYDKLIIIWSFKKKEWVCSQKLQGHTDYVLCLTSTNVEDLIVSGGFDKKIKFWIKQNDWQCQQTISDLSGHVLGLSLNESSNKLISGGQTEIIQIFEKQPSNQWVLMQQIQVKVRGLRLHFITDDTFVFQLRNQDVMLVFEMNSQTKSFIQINQIQKIAKGADCNSLFPMQLVKFKTILLNKNGHHVNILKRLSDGSFTLDQSIDFGTKRIYGCITEDGKYLITWDDKSKEIQIRTPQE